eukprot:jgi/Psemu1/290957/fgenesh1_pg.593_\
MAFQQTSFGSNNDPFAGALAAAAALARTGAGTFLFESSGSRSANPPNLVFPVPAPSAASTATENTAIAASPPPPPVVSSEEASRHHPHQDHHREDGTYSNHSDPDEDLSSSPSPPSPSHSHDHHHHDHHHEDDEQNAERRIARSRERNREHARRTRRRKKAQLEALQSKLRGLQEKNKELTQSLEECQIASILVGFSASDGDERDATIQSLLREATELGAKDIFKRVVGGGGSSSKRTRFVSDASDMAAADFVAVAASLSQPPCGSASSSASSFPLTIKINGTTAVIGGDSPSHLNWKTAVYTDASGTRTHLTTQQIDALRRERNRMHAKMTRDRKKSFIANIEKTIEELESSNERMASVLADVIHVQKTPPSSPRSSSPSPASPAAATLVSFRSKRHNDPPGNVTPCGSPAVAPGYVSVGLVPDLIPAPSESSVTSASGKPLTKSEAGLPPPKRVCHGFSLGPTEWNRN